MINIISTEIPTKENNILNDKNIEDIGLNTEKNDFEI